MLEPMFLTYVLWLVSIAMSDLIMQELEGVALSIQLRRKEEYTMLFMFIFLAPIFALVLMYRYWVKGK